MKPRFRPMPLLIISLQTVLLVFAIACGEKKEATAANLSRQPTLYVVGYAHLDTQWRWDYPTTIRDYLTKTMRVNFDFIEKYPHYIFNFSGARRYLMMKEYYPAEYEKVKAYIAAGRWFPSGSSFEENDVNSPSARIDRPPTPLRDAILPAGVRQDQRRVHAPGLFRIPGFSPQHPGPLRHQGLFDPEAVFELAAGAPCRRAGFARKDARRHSLQRRHLGRPGRQVRARRPESRELRRPDHL